MCAAPAAETGLQVQTTTARRDGGRGGRAGRSAREGHAIAQKPFRQPRRPYSFTEAVSADGLEAIHDASMRILEEIGIDVLHEEVKDIFRKAGAEVDPGSDRVRMDRGLIAEAIATCPAEFTMHARNPAHNVHFGGNSVAFAQMASAPNCSDMDRGRRPGNQQDFRDLVKLGQVFNIIHLSGGYPVEPVDLHASIRHLECLRDFATLTDKIFHVYSLGKERNRDGIEIARIARGVSHDQLEREPSVLSIINSSSPLRLDTPMMQGIIEMSRRNQVIVMTPFTLAGAMAPVTIAGALAQQNAEALAGIALTQLVRPGAPVVYGGFTSNVDMKSGAPAFGTPEYMKAAIVGGQLARRYNLPYRTSNTCAANTVDAQAAYESVFSLWGAIMGGGNFIKHSAGWMEGGLTCSFEKFILDVDLLQMVAEFLNPLVVDDSTLALDAIRDVGPGGHFFGTAHTQERYRDAFYAPLISDWRNFETWSEAGSPTAYQKANRLWKEALAQYEQPPLDPAIAEELDDFVERRKAEGGAPTDF
ncbi:trimethylamine methyltransferase family protein [Microbaculum marinum]|uniref:Methyltransferase n=1 Tax=Microbaculum marinum TaxID=1764581 RepID=A0AAW9RVY5_9HYPH